MKITHESQVKVSHRLLLTTASGDPYRIESASRLSVEIMHHIIQIFVNHQPVREIFFNGDEYWGNVDQVDDTYTSYFSDCRKVVVSNGPTEDGVKRKVCLFYTAHRHWYLAKEWYGWSQCDYKFTECLTGYCQRGDCEKSQYGEFCKCHNKHWTVDFRKRPYIGEYCTVGKVNDLEINTMTIEAYEIEIDFDDENGSVLIELVPVFDGWNYKYFFLRVYKLLYKGGKIRQELVAYENDKTQTETDKSKVFVFKNAESNTSYFIVTYGRQSLEDPTVGYTSIPTNQSFAHFTEIHTPGYSLLHPPHNLVISTERGAGNLFYISWNYTGDIAPQEYLVTMRNGGEENKEITHDMFDYLALRSNTTYGIYLSAINAIGQSGPESETLTFTTPYFEYDSKSYGTYEFAKWFFNENGIHMSNRYVNFKNTVRRDIRIERVVIMLNASLLEEDQSNGGDTSAVFHAAVNNQTYQSHDPYSPYITASFNKGPDRNMTLPRRVLIGDQGVYDGYSNGDLDPNFEYTVHVIVWYKSGYHIEISVQYLGVIKLSKIPWVTIFVAIAVGTSTLTILNAVFSCLFYRIVLVERHRKAKMLKGSLSSKSLLVEKIYDEEILADPDYDMTYDNSDNKVRPSTFSLMD